MTWLFGHKCVHQTKILRKLSEQYLHNGFFSLTVISVCTVPKLSPKSFVSWTKVLTVLMYMQSKLSTPVQWVSLTSNISCQNRINRRSLLGAKAKVSQTQYGAQIWSSYNCHCNSLAVPSAQVWATILETTSGVLQKATVLICWFRR